MYDKYYSSFQDAEFESIMNLVGCKKPCFYRKYSFFGQKRNTNFQTDSFIFSFYSHSNYTRVEKEQLIYPLSSLVAEFGGTLGLFLATRSICQNSTELGRG